jgi:hypothetical protein
MKLDELITLKALEIKRSNSGQSEISDRITDEMLMKSDGAEFRNVCAHLSIPLATEIDSICSLLSISKRRFIEGALIAAVARANATIAEVKPFDLEG